MLHWCFHERSLFFVGSAVKTLSGDGVSIPGVICSGRQLIPAEWNGCQEIGPECQRSPPVFHWQLASQVHLWGQSANQNKGVSYCFAAHNKRSTCWLTTFHHKSVSPRLSMFRICFKQHSASNANLTIMVKSLVLSFLCCSFPLLTVGTKLCLLTTARVISQRVDARGLQRWSHHYP